MKILKLTYKVINRLCIDFGNFFEILKFNKFVGLMRQFFLTWENRTERNRIFYITTISTATDGNAPGFLTGRFMVGFLKSLDKRTVFFYIKRRFVLDQFVFRRNF